jgi:hypothetical protein
MKSIIIYTLTTAPVTNPKLYTKVGPVWIRHELFNGTVDEALDAASPRPGESVSNTYELPEPAAFRILTEGEIIDARDEVCLPYTGWEVVSEDDPVVGAGWVPREHYPIRRPLKSFEDAY